MLSKQRILLIIFTINVGFLLAACTSNAEDSIRYSTLIAATLEPTFPPSPTLFRFPEKDILPPPTLTTAETFECWTAPHPESASRDQRRGELLISYQIAGTDIFNLYRFNFEAQKYSLVASQIEAYAPSPDGLNIWYSFYQTSKRSLLDVVFVHELANNTRHQVPFPIPIESTQRQVVWSPDSQCLFAWRGDTAFTYRLKDGAVQSKIFPGANFGYRASSVSPDGRWWAWSCEKNTCLMSPQGQRADHAGLQLPISVDPRSGYYNPSWSRWSPDGHVLAIAYPGHDYQYQNAVRLIYLDENGVSSFQDVELKEDVWSLDDLLWSPDSRQLLILDNVGDLVIYNPATKKTITAPTPEGNYLEAAAWSPDGKQIAIVIRDKQYKFGLYVMNADGTNASEIPPLPKDVEGAEMVVPIFWIDQIYWVP